ncbi:MAG: EamA family transporter [Deltaproteobacteria bacterium]|nr:EamA family transporter [Deltaproteobacteria bacterium]
MKPTSTSSRSSQQRFFGIIFILISAAAFGAMPIFANYAYAYGTEPITLLVLRFTLASGIMLIYNMFRNARFPKGRVLIISILMGGIGYAGQSFTYFTALLYAPAGTVAILLYLYPALVTGFSILFFKKKITRPEIIALILALTGTVCVIGLETGGKPLGIILGVMAAFIYSTYIITGSRIMPNTDVITTSTVIMMSAGAVYTMGILIRGPQFPTHVAGWSAVGGIVVFSTVIAIVTFFEGLKRIGPVHSSMLSTLEPVVTVALAWIAFNEGVTLIKFIGGAMILMAGIMLARKPSRPPSE